MVLCVFIVVSCLVYVILDFVLLVGRLFLSKVNIITHLCVLRLTPPYPHHLDSDRTKLAFTRIL